MFSEMLLRNPRRSVKRPSNERARPFGAGLDESFLFFDRASVHAIGKCLSDVIGEVVARGLAGTRYQPDPVPLVGRV